MRHGWMAATIFWAWQDTLPRATNRTLIERALEGAARAIHDDGSIAVEPAVVRDTSGEPGSPDIVATIFARIEVCDVFVCDVSLIDGVPNPNVLIELGYAIRAHGWGRVVMVFNTAFGAVEDLPFDLRGKRVLKYEACEDDAERAPVRRALESTLRRACDAIFRKIATEPREVSTERQVAIEFDPDGSCIETPVDNGGTTIIRRAYVVAVRNCSAFTIDDVALRIERCWPNPTRMSLPRPLLLANEDSLRHEHAAKVHTLDRGGALEFRFATIRNPQAPTPIALHTLPKHTYLPAHRYVVVLAATGRDTPPVRAALSLEVDERGLLRCDIATPEDVSNTKAAAPTEQPVIKRATAPANRRVRYRFESSWMRRGE